MKLRPELDGTNIMGWKQSQDVQVGVHGKVCEHSDISAVISNGTKANLTSTFHPNSNVDFSVTTELDMHDLYGKTRDVKEGEDDRGNMSLMDVLGNLKPAFGINIHD